MQLKTGVKAEGVKPEILLAIVIAGGVYREYARDLVITSIADGKHMVGSKHYDGLGVDLRLIPGIDNAEVAAKIKGRLSDEYDVVLEKDHIHVEFDPK